MAKAGNKHDSAVSDGNTTPGAQSAVEGIVDAIKAGIRTGRYAPGQRLIEADIAAEFGLKRGPVREALRMLAGDGIVELIPQKGARVRKLEQADLVELLPVLSGLVRLTIRLSAGKLDDPAIRMRLEQTMDQMRAAAALEDFNQFQLAGLAYLAILREAANNRYLDYLDGKLHADLFRRQLGSRSRVANWHSFLDYFESLHGALMAGDPDRAMALVEAHEARTLDDLDITGDGIIWL